MEDGYIIVGAVYRGKDALEGVLSGVSEKGLNEAIGDLVQGSKHYGQIRLILLDEEKLPEQVSASGLWEQTEKPVLLFSREGTFFDHRFHLRYKNRLVYAAGIDEGSVTRVLDKIHGVDGVLALDMADIILNRISGLHKV